MVWSQHILKDMQTFSLVKMCLITYDILNVYDVIKYVTIILYLNTYIYANFCTFDLEMGEKAP